MAQRKKVLGDPQALPDYSDILRVPSRVSNPTSTPKKVKGEEKRSKAYHIRSSTIEAIENETSSLQVPIGDFVDFLLIEGLKAIQQGKLEVPVSQGKKRIILS